MTNTIKVSDVSVEKAIQKGLRQLGLPQDQVFVEVISEGKKGLFGFGQKNAEVELTPVATMVSEEAVEEVVEPVVEAVEEATAEESGRLHNVTKQQIITLFSHGNSVESISEQLNVPVSTVQLVIDNYFEADAN